MNRPSLIVGAGIVVVAMSLAFLVWLYLEVIRQG
jgi:hypothetical protein